MSETMLKYQCPACGGPLNFNPGKQLLVCDFCDSEYPEDMFKQKDDEYEKNEAQSTPDNTEVPTGERVDWSAISSLKQKEILEAQPGFACTSCGAEIVSDGDTVATECMYCSNPVVIATNVTGMVQPDWVIPFQVKKDEAEQKLKDFCKDKFLLPKSFVSSNRISKITGMYVPFWLFSCSGSGHIKYTATIVKKWSDSNYNYTKTDTYGIERAGSIAFDHIPTDASSKMEDHYMDGLEPYDYRDFKDFEPMYMAGYFANKFDVSVDDSTPRATTRVVQSVRDAFRSTIHGYTTVNETMANVNMHGEDVRYSLLPVWMLNTKYNGEMYQFAINGQTGRVSGKLPIDTFKLWLLRLGTFVVSTLIFSGLLAFAML